MTAVKKQRTLAVASVMALVALGLFAWSVLDPRPMPIIVAMSVGQAIGTVSLVLFVIVAGFDALRAMRAIDKKR